MQMKLTELYSHNISKWYQNEMSSLLFQIGKHKHVINLLRKLLSPCLITLAISGFSFLRSRDIKDNF